MKTIGLLGGMSWESTVLYYQLLNQGVRARLGGLFSAPIVMHSFNFAEIEHYQVTGQWETAGRKLGRAARSLEEAGADVVLICTNLMHKVAPLVEAKIGVPLLHIADAAGRAALRLGLKTVGLLGTRYTMEEGFYRERLVDRFGLEVIVPGSGERERVHRIIFDELCQGRFSVQARSEYLDVIEQLRQRGAEGMILGCTEIPLLVRPEDVDLPLFNTTALHAEMALEFAFGEEDFTAGAFASAAVAGSPLPFASGVPERA